MSKTLLEQLPEIVRAGKRQAERIMEGLEARSRVGLQTRELVTPAKDTNWQEFQSLKPHAKAQTTLGGDLALLNETEGQTQLVANHAEWFNRLIYGDNLLAMTTGEVLTVELANYVLLSPDALNLEQASREKLQKITASDPLALVEYWSFDPDSDGEVFRSVWQDYRGNTDNDHDPLHVAAKRS